MDSNFSDCQNDEESKIIQYNKHRGCMGRRGLRGEKGPTGEMGPIGEIGPPGERGERGFIGPKGSPGERGYRGSPGPIGITGPSYFFIPISSKIVSDLKSIQIGHMGQISSYDKDIPDNSLGIIMPCKSNISFISTTWKGEENISLSLIKYNNKSPMTLLKIDVPNNLNVNVPLNSMDILYIIIEGNNLKGNINISMLIKI